MQFKVMSDEATNMIMYVSTSHPVHLGPSCLLLYFAVHCCHEHTTCTHVPHPQHSDLSCQLSLSRPQRKPQPSAHHNVDRMVTTITM
jgi:hypothetical protein